MDNLAEFIVRAKQATYASGGEIGEGLGEGQSKVFEFLDGSLRYQDRYFGFDPFLGEEIVWLNGFPIWGMNYYGRVLGGRPSSYSEIFEFLRMAMREVKIERPFRGPEDFTSGILRYVDESTGTLESFSGSEAIYRSGIQVYELSYHGGLVKPKESSNERQ